MRIPSSRILLAAALLLPVPALAYIVGRPDSAARICGRDDRVLPAATAASPGGFQRLDRLPAAKEYLTVYRSVGGCPAPVIVRYEIGMSAAAPRR